MRALLYTDTPSGYEILLVTLEGVSLGVAYDPRRSASVIPWHAECNHCARGLQRGLSIQVKRAIQLLRTKRPSTTGCGDTYLVPTNSAPHRVNYYIEGKLRRATVTRDDSERVIEVTAEPMCEITYERGRELCTPILRRCLPLLFSQRPATAQEVVAATCSLTDHQRRHGIPSGHHNRCNTIDWLDIVSRLEERRRR